MNALPNRYPGKCRCGKWVPANAGAAVPNQTGRGFLVRCEVCAPAAAPMTAWNGDLEAAPPLVVP